MPLSKQQRIKLRAQNRVDAVIMKHIGHQAFYKALFGGTIAKLRKDYADGNLDATNTNTGVSNTNHHASSVADLIVEASDGKVARPQALHWLLYNRDGAALLNRLSTSKQQTTEGDMPRNDLLQEVVKAAGGLIAFAKNIVVKPSRAVII